MAIDTRQAAQARGEASGEATAAPTSTASAAAAPLDLAAVEAFAGKVLTDAAATTATIMATIGDRLGLFRSLAQDGPATSTQLAARTGTAERYAREWLLGMSAAGYLTYDALTGQFALPATHAPVLAQEGGPAFMGGIQQMLIGMLGPIEQLYAAFKSGGGVPQSAFPEDWWSGLDRFTAGWFENLLLQSWIPALPAVRSLLERGADVADVGSGRGRALIKLAQAFPNSRFVGYDMFAPAVADANVRAAAAGVADRVRFEVCDVAQGLPATYDIITTFDVIHDAVDPRGLLRAIQAGLKPGGRYVCLDISSPDRPEEHTGPLATLRFGTSICYCMTTSLAGHGEGLGTVGLSESKLRALCVEAGFGAFRLVPQDSPFNYLYEVEAAG